MPVLPLEPFLHPPDLFGAAAEPPDDSPVWWVLHTRPRAEKMLARHLLRRDVSFFLPLFQRERLFRGRLVTSHLPLFSGYVFLRGDHQARTHALVSNLVAQTLPVNDQAQLRTDLARVYELMATGAPLSPVDRLGPGSWVRVTAGPLAGMEGKVIRRGRRLKFIIEVHFLQRGAAVELDRWMIEPR
jgi:transcriptional antiterminator RfaH